MLPKFILDAINLSVSLASIISFPLVALPLILAIWPKLMTRAGMKHLRPWAIALLIVGAVAYTIDLSDRFDWPLPWSRIVPKHGPPQVVGEMFLEFNGAEFRQRGSGTLGIEHYETFPNDGTFEIELKREVDPNTYVIRKEGSDENLQITKRTERSVRFKLNGARDLPFGLVIRAVPI